jgi:hypothetical protein
MRAKFKIAKTGKYTTWSSEVMWAIRSSLSKWSACYALAYSGEETDITRSSLLKWFILLRIIITIDDFWISMLDKLYILIVCVWKIQNKALGNKKNKTFTSQATDLPKEETMFV